MMLGALDSDFEMRTEEALEVETFGELHAPERWRLVGAEGFTEHPMAKAIEAFRSRKVVPPDVFKKMTAAAKRRSFTVAGMVSEAMLETVKDELAKRVEDEADLRSFQTFAKERLESAGWTPANKGHVETIFRTNIQSAYGAGRYRQMTQPDVMAWRPYAQVLTPNDGPPRQRPWHQAAHLKVFRLSELTPEMMTPWGFNCRCRMRSLSQRQLDAGGFPIEDASWLDANGLPDEGFTGGGAGLDGALPGPPPPPAPPEPQPAPMEPQAPEAARKGEDPDAAPEPKKRKPRREKTTQSILDRIGAPTPLVSGGEHPLYQRATAVGMEKALGRGGVLGRGDVRQLSSLQFTDRITAEGAPNRNYDSMGRMTISKYVGGWYQPSTRTLRMGTNVEGSVNCFILSDKTEPSDFSARRLPQNVANLGRTPEEVIEINSCHEMAHHIHMAGLRPEFKDHKGITRLLDNEPDPKDEADVLIAEEFANPDRTPTSAYGESDRFEFWAEGLTAYRYMPRSWMKLNAPRMLDLVERVLSLRGLK